MNNTLLIPSADIALEKLRNLSQCSTLDGISGNELLLQRASYMQLSANQPFSTNQPCSANGCCHLLQDDEQHWIALNLSRPDDWALLPALFQISTPLNDITEVTTQVKKHKAGLLVPRGRELGLGIASPPPQNTSSIDPLTDNWFHKIIRRENAFKHNSEPLVVDLSSLWAGPLCSHLLQLCGAAVIKVESTQRPDGSRMNTKPGAQLFYQHLNEHKELMIVDFSSEDGIQQLKNIINKADIVIEGSRPRALKQLGIDAEAIVRDSATIWVSITGYGRSAPQANWIAFGDDAAISGGLYQTINNQPAFMGDAIADPLTGLHAALAAYRCWDQKEACLLDINLHTVANYCAKRLHNVIN